MSNPLAVELRELIEARIKSHERSLQTVIGPSELGTPCNRRLGYKLSNTPPVEARAADIPWRPTVGSAIHDWMAAMLRADNTRRVMLGEPERWIVEEAFPCGTINGVEIPGHADVIDLQTGTIVDWKFPGPTALKQYRRDLAAEGGLPPRGYRVQVHLYARGAIRKLNVKIRTVALYFLPMNGDLDEGVYWSEPVDLERANRIFHRARDIDAWLAEEGRSVLPQLSTKPDYCQHCDYFSPGSTDVENACPGDPAIFAKAKEDRFEDLLGPQ